MAPMPSAATGPAARVLLIHGIWMRGPSLWPLARRLARAGFAPEPFAYASVRGNPAETIARLRAAIGTGSAPVHVLGHSLGGMLALEAVRDPAGLAPGRVVCLGSPVAGSGVARRLQARRGLRPLLGRSAPILCTGLAPWNTAREVGLVAGTRGFGIGHLVGGLVPPDDGTVALAETRLAGLPAPRTVRSSHTGLLLSREVARLAIGFLREGRFPPPAEPARR